MEPIAIIGVGVTGTAEIFDCNLDILDARIATLKKWVEQNCL